MSKIDEVRSEMMAAMKAHDLTLVFGCWSIDTKTCKNFFDRSSDLCFIHHLWCEFFEYGDSCLAFIYDIGTISRCCIDCFLCELDLS